MRHGFWCHWKWVIWCFACFWGPRKSDKCCMRGYACTKIFYSWNSVTLDFEGHICQIMSFEDPCCALSNFFLEKKKFICWCQLRPKMTIKGRKKIEIKGAEIRKKVVISLCLFIAKKKCAPKTRATLAMPNILVRRLLSLSVCGRMWTFLCPD